MKIIVSRSPKLTSDTPIWPFSDHWRHSFTWTHLHHLTWCCWSQPFLHISSYPPLCFTRAAPQMAPKDYLTPQQSTVGVCLLLLCSVDFYCSYTTYEGMYVRNPVATGYWLESRCEETLWGASSADAINAVKTSNMSVGAADREQGWKPLQGRRGGGYR